MTVAGRSAGFEARRQRAIAIEATRTAARANAAAGRYAVAEMTERRVAENLSILSARGYHLLPDRAWLESKTANVDLILIGPGGVFFVDTKAWAEVALVDGRIYQGQDDVTDRLDNLAGLARDADGILAEIGLAPGEVHAVAVFASRRNFRGHVGSVEIVGEHDVVEFIRRKGDRLSQREVDKVVKTVMERFPVLDLNGLTPVSATDDPGAPARAPKHQAPTPLLSEPTETDTVSIAAILPEPIESWMTFLDPAQAKLARRSFNGPARIRGGAGTGKTVVGLHRAAYLARSGGPSSKVLFATFTKSLPKVFGTLLATMVPELADRVEFTSIHSFAMRLLRQRGITVSPDATAADNAFYRAYSQHVHGGVLPVREGITPAYWKDEIAHVIKGRGITDFDQYADLARIGRRHRLTHAERKAVWALYSSYEVELRSRGVVDYADVILRALRSVQAIPLADYTAVIIDEAQDLSCAMVALLAGLVGDRPDGLTLIGDGQQTIYPGGYSLSEVGVSLAGRGVVMDVNHRNTREILEFAATLVAGDEFVDIEGPVGRQDPAVAVDRSGPSAEVVRFDSATANLEGVVDAVRAAASSDPTALGDMAVLALTRSDVAALQRAMSRADIPWMSLDDYRGTPVAAIKVGTIKRSKGLEFKHTFVAGVPARLFDATDRDNASETERERVALQRRELFVGATRARDRLWFGVVAAAPEKRPKGGPA